ncbi:MAG: PAS domain S-box protein, partial [Ignavibacteriales bacterium]|nr:PAS domain S-box protein [Ignavibacteriales bacterium]
MDYEAHTRLGKRIAALPRIAGVTAISVGAIVFVGWIFDILLLKSLHPSLVAMKANAALAFILAGTSLLLMHSSAKRKQMKRVAQSLALFVIVIGLLTSIEYAAGWNIGIDQLLFKELPGAAGTLHGGRMPFSAALSFVFFGTAILVLELRTRRGNMPGQILAMTVGFLGVLGLLGYINNLPEFVGYAVHTHMAAQGAVTFIALSIGVLALKPDDGIMGVITGAGLGGLLARRLLPAAVGMPVVIGWLTTEGESLGLCGNQFGAVIAAAAYIAIALFLVWRIARSLNRIDAERKLAESELLESEIHFKDLFDDAPVGYHELDMEGRYSRINQTELRVLGYRAEEMLGRFCWEFVRDQEESRHAVLAKLSGTQPPARGVERIFRRKDGTTITVMIEDQLLRDALGDIIGIRTTLQDLTEWKRAERLTGALHSISQAIHSTSNLNELFEHIHRDISNIISANNFFIALLSDDGKTLHFPYERDETGADESSIIDADNPQSLTVEVLQSKWPLLLDEKELHNRYSTGRNKVWGTAPKCWLGVPLILSEKAIGVMVVQDYKRGDVYSQKDVALFESAAGQIAVAIERKRAGDALAWEEYLLNALLQNVPDHIYFKDPEGRFMRISRDQAKVFGLSDPSQAVGKTDFDFFTGEHARLAYEDEQEIIRTGRSLTKEEKETWPDRLETWVLTTKMPLLDKDGKIIGTFGISRDITDRKRAEDVLKDSESSLRYAQEIAKMGSWEWNMVTQETNWSDQYFAIHGFKPTEVEPSFELFRNRIHPEDVHLLDETRANIMKGRTPASLELRIIHPDGTVKWLQNNIAPVIEDDRLVGLRGVIIDVTERKLAEKAIIASELELRRVWESTFDGMRVVDGEGTILMVNEAYCTMIAKSREELVGKPFSIFTVESLQRQTLEKHKQRFSSGTIAPRAEKELVLWNGRRVWFEVSSSFLEIEGQPKALLSIFRDATDRKRAEDALAKKTELFRLVSSLTTDYIFVDTITKDGKVELDLLIGAVEQITGYTEEEYRANGSWSALVHPDDREKDERDFHKLVNNEKVVSEIRTLHKDGHTRWMKVYGDPIW